MWYLYMWVNVVEALCVSVTSHFLIHMYAFTKLHAFLLMHVAFYK